MSQKGPERRSVLALFFVGGLCKMYSKIINLRCNRIVIEKAEKVANALGLNRSAAIRFSISMAERMLSGSGWSETMAFGPAGSHVITKNDS